MDPGGRLRVTAAPPFWLIAGAYGDALGGLRPEQIVGATSGRIVANRTGLTGPFAVDLDWSQDQKAADKPSIFTAVQEQLGLKLESTRGPVDVLVLDAVERPTPD